MIGGWIDCICGERYTMTHDGTRHTCPSCGHVWKLWPDHKTCEQCGRVFYPTHGSLYHRNRQRYCSRRCKTQAKDIRKRLSMKMARCLWCGSEYESHRTRGARFCSIACRTAYLITDKLRLAPFQCQTCGRTFTRSGSNNRFCSTACRPSSAPKPVIVCECRWCGTSFVKERSSQYCSRLCAARYRSMMARPRRVAIRTASERISFGDIVKRDNGQCGICGKRVSLSVKWPSPKSASIDHIVPLSKGGEHKAANVQLAHYGCNSSKRATDRGSQLLIGA